MVNASTSLCILVANHATGQPSHISPFNPDQVADGAKYTVDCNVTGQAATVLNINMPNQANSYYTCTA